jgi:hypothetical protein
MRRLLLGIAIAALAAGAASAWIYATTNFDATSGKGWRPLASAPRERFHCASGRTMLSERSSCR